MSEFVLDSEFGLPIHPRTGLMALGIGKRGPIWPIAGGAPIDGEEDGEPDAVVADDDPDDGEKGDEPVTFASKDEFIKHVNGIVKQRLDRNNKKYAPIVAERDTLKAEAEKRDKADLGNKSDEEQRNAREAAMQKQIDELLLDRKKSQRNELVRRVAKDKGLPEEFIPHVHIEGDDEDDIADSIESFVALLPADSKVVKAKETKPSTKDEGKGGKGTGGGSGRDNDEALDPKKLADKIGRYGRNMPYVVQR